MLVLLVSVLVCKPVSRRRLAEIFVAIQPIVLKLFQFESRF